MIAASRRALSALLSFMPQAALQSQSVAAPQQALRRGLLANASLPAHAHHASRARQLGPRGRIMAARMDSHAGTGPSGRIGAISRHFVADYNQPASPRNAFSTSPLRRALAASTSGDSAPAGDAGNSRPLSTTSGPDESQLTVGELKQILNESGVDFRDCFEKAELVDRLKQARATMPPAVAARLDSLLFRTDSSADARDSNPLDGLFMDEINTVALFKRCSPAVVNIVTSVAVRGLSMDITEIPQGAGSGIVWDAAGHVVTNFHVIRDAGVAKITLADNTTYDAKLVGYEADKDLAVLKIVKKASPTSPPTSTSGGDASGLSLPAPFNPITVGTSQNLQVGQRVFAIGNPFGLDQTLTQGIVSGVGRDIRSITGTTIRDVVQTDAAINPGNSGGPLLDSRGRLIGVNTVIYSPSGASAGVGFAIPVDTVRRVVNQLIRFGRVVRPSLGLHCAGGAQSRLMGLPGVLVIEVTPGGPAEAAGVKGTSRDRFGNMMRGDVIVEVEGSRTQTVEDLLAAVESRSVGEEVTLVVQREGGARVPLRCRLQERPAPAVPPLFAPRKPLGGPMGGLLRR